MCIRDSHRPVQAGDSLITTNSVATCSRTVSYTHLDVYKRQSIAQVEIPQETDMEFKHKSVLLDETIEGLRVKPDGIYVDGTLGGA